MAVRTRDHIEELDRLIELWPGSGINPVQVSSGALQMTLDGAIAPELTVLHMVLAPKIVDHVFVDRGRTGFVIVDRPMVSMGAEVSQGSLLINHSEREYRSVLEAGFRSTEFMLDDEAIAHHELGQLLDDARKAQDQTIIPLAPHLHCQLKSAADAYLAAAEAPQFGSDLGLCALHEARERVLRLLAWTLKAHESLVSEPSAAPARGSLAVAALREIERVGAAEIKLKDVCERLSVSRRAVEKSFEGLLGISPAQYLLACRLNHLRRSLLTSPGGVSDGLASAGLVDASRAARQYRRLFGELPSSTLERARTRLCSVV